MQETKKQPTKTQQKIIALVTAVVVLIGIALAVLFYFLVKVGFTQNEIRYQLTSVNGKLGYMVYSNNYNILYNSEDKKYYAGYTETEIYIPKKVNGLPVISIGRAAFMNLTEIEKIELPDSILSIGQSAFYNCNKLSQLNIPNNVKEIGESAFDYCSSLTNISIPNSVTSIGQYAFNGCTGLTSVVVPESVQYIGKSAFANSTKTICCIAKSKPENWDNDWNKYYNENKIKIEIHVIWGYQLEEQE